MPPELHNSPRMRRPTPQPWPDRGGIPYTRSRSRSSGQRSPDYASEADDMASPGANRFVRDVPSLLPGSSTSRSASPFRLAMPSTTPGQLAFSALQFLPVPVLVLDNLKTVVLANEALGQLLGLYPGGADAMVPVMDTLRGQSLSQVGIDLIQDGGPVWIEWEQFLDQVAAELELNRTKRIDTVATSRATEGDAKPAEDDVKMTGLAEESHDKSFPGPCPSANSVVEVVISRRDFNRTAFDSRVQSKADAFQEYAKMIISTWDFGDSRTYFTLTFTSTESTPAQPVTRKRPFTRASKLEVGEKRTATNANGPLSISSSHDSRSPLSGISPSAVTMSTSPFPPLGPPSKSSLSSTPSTLQKITVMKDALLDNTTTPVLAMWKDGSVTFPNRAARDLFDTNVDLESPADGFELLPAWTVWTEDFSRQLDPSEYPISVIIRTETPFTGFRIGMLDNSGKRLVFDAEGAAIRDQHTGEFLAGVVTCRDVTKLTEEISRIKEADEERFKIICDMMPQLVWTANPQGMHDFFNSRWYSYTGLAEHDSLGLGWKNPFHPDDTPEAERRWKHSLETGEPYVIEYRCRSKEGEWNWFLGRALPLRDRRTGKIEKWFGKASMMA